MSERLDGKRALITGASRGVGRAVALALSARGAHCTLLARGADALAQTAALCEGPADVLALDLSDPDAVAAAPSDFDVFVHAASPMFEYQKLHAISGAELDAMLRVNVGAAAQICRGVLPHMMLGRWGRVVLIGSVGGRLAARGGSHYDLSKAALESLGRSIALEYARYHVTANTLVLGAIDGERLAERDAAYPGARKKALDRAPGRRLPTPAQVADVASWLCSDASSPVNGASIDVSCGAHLGNAW
jgi:NAD(P)-dependent dehydrogenase (short-subunit alcohol dehydrogenase family)